jgi:arylsulfatase A
MTPRFRTSSGRGSGRATPSRRSATRLAVFAVCAAACLAQGPATRPNFVFVMADDLGYGEVGCFGQTKIATPRLDRMAAEGTRLTQWYASAPVCAPTRASLMTGRHMGHAPIRDNREVQPEGQAPLPADATTLPGVLRAAGYDTAMIGKWGIGAPGSPGEPGRQGFDAFFGYLCQREAHHFYPDHLWRLTPDAASRDAVRVPLPGNAKKAGPSHAQDLFRDELRAFVRGRAARRDRPFFLYLPFTLPHLALQPPDADLAAYRGKFEETPYDGKKGYLAHPTPRAAYAAMISRLDADVGVLLDELAAAGLDRDTLVLFTSDNGPTHDVGGVDTAFFASAGPYRGRKGSAYEGGLRVPTIARWPGRVPAGRASDHVGVHYDVLATACALAGTPAPQNDGVNALPVLVGEVPRVSRPLVYWEFPGYGGWQVAREGDLKLVRKGLKAEGLVEELYDLAADPAESRDLARTRPADVARLRAAAAAQRVPHPDFPHPALDG